MGKASMFNLDLENVALFATKTKTAKYASSSSDGTYHPAGPSVHKGTSEQRATTELKNSS